MLVRDFGHERKGAVSVLREERILRSNAILKLDSLDLLLHGGGGNNIFDGIRSRHG